MQRNNFSQWRCLTFLLSLTFVLFFFSDTNKGERVYGEIISMKLQMEFQEKGVSCLTLRAWSEKFH